MNQTNWTRKYERRILKKYLSRYFKARKNQDLLQDRLHNLQRQFHPEAEGGDALSPSEIEAKLQAQAKAAERSVVEVMEILEHLPQNTTERIILELRHLDCKPWEKIQATVYLTASPCFDYYNRGLDALLAVAAVRRKIGLPAEATGGDS